MEELLIDVEVKEIISGAIQLRRKGEYDGALRVLDKAEKRIEGLLFYEAKLLRVLIHHARGRTQQAMKKYRIAEGEIVKAINLGRAIKLGRKEPGIYARLMFQLFICRDYAGRPLSFKENKEVQMALLKLIIVSKDFKEIGEAFQNLSYMESKLGDTKKAILLYLATKEIRKEAKDLRGLAMTWARLGECYRKVGNDFAKEKYGRLALSYFEQIGDIERMEQVKKNVFGEE